MSEPPDPITFMSFWIGIVIAWAAFGYLRDMIMEKINDRRMLREEIEEEKEQLRVEIKDIENT